MSVDEMETELKKLIPKMESHEINDFGETIKIKSIYLGSYMSLDPCGRYHVAISPNGITDECIEYWDNLEQATNNLNGYITDGEGDPTDIFFEIVGDD